MIPRAIAVLIAAALWSLVLLTLIAIVLGAWRAYWKGLGK